MLVPITLNNGYLLAYLIKNKYTLYISISILRFFTKALLSCNTCLLWPLDPSVQANYKAKCQNPNMVLSIHLDRWCFKEIIQLNVKCVNNKKLIRRKKKTIWFNFCRKILIWLENGWGTILGISRYSILSNFSKSSWWFSF